MDTNDAISINKQIETIQSNTHQIESTLEYQHKFNTALQNRLLNVTNHINTEQDKIELYLNKLMNSISKEDNRFLELQYINQINYNIDLLNNHLANIAESIILAKLKIIPKFILSTEEIDEIYEQMKNQSLKIISKEQIYELLQLQAYYNNSNIIFNIQIPNLSKETYKLYHIVPLPINETKQIKIKPYITYNKNNIQFFDTNCPKIEGQYYCKSSQYSQHTTNSTCIAPLINNRDAICDLEDNGEISSITQPEPNYILFINVNKTVIKSSCNEEPYDINGTALLHYINCTIYVNDEVFKDTPLQYKEEIFIPPANYAKITPRVIKEKLSLKKLRKYQIENYEASSKKNKGILIVIFTFGIAVILIIAYTTKKTKVKYLPNHLFNAPAPKTSLWPSLYFMGGGVTAATATSTTTPTRQPPEKPPRARTQQSSTPEMRT